MNGAARQEIVSCRQEHFRRRIIVECRVGVLEIDPRGMPAEGVKCCKCSADMNVNLLEAGCVEAEVLLHCFRHSLLERWVEKGSFGEGSVCRKVLM